MAMTRQPMVARTWRTLATAVLMLPMIFSTASQAAAPYESPEALRAERALAAVKDTDSPRKVYDAFNEFCRTHFGAENTPLVYERFGDELQFIDEGQWRHVSENSASLAWETTLPAGSYVEYGPTAEYGSQTETTDRPYYLHMHRLTGLDTGKTYHYRLVAVDERGNKLVSPDQTLTISPVSGAIHIPGDAKGAPLILDKDGATYILTRDLTTSGTAIIAEGDNITVDLNGHTITFAEQGTESEDVYGIIGRGTGDTALRYLATNLKVLNGTVQQGQGPALASNKESLSLNPLLLKGRDIEMAGVTIIYHAPQAWGMQLSHTSGKINLHHNVFKDMGAKIVNRHGNAVRTLGFRHSKESPNQFEIHHNLIKRTRQNGIREAHQMYCNEVYVDSWSINSFAIQPDSAPGVDAGEHYNNRVFGTGFNAYGFGWAHENLKIHDNFIYMFGIDLKERWIHQEDWGDINMLEGVRVTNYGKGGQVRNNLEYWGNLIILRGKDDVELRGTGFFSDETIEGLAFRDNIVKVEALDRETTRISCVAAHGHFRKEDSKPVYYRDNRFISNVALVRFGDSYGKGNNHHFERCRFEKIGNHPAFHTFVFGGAYWSTGHVVLDGDFGPGTAAEDVYWQRTGAQSHYTVKWTLDLHVRPRATVKVVDTDGETEFSGRAGDDGKLQIPLTQGVVRPVEWSPDSPTGGVDHKGQHQMILKTPHTVTVTADGKTVTRSVDMIQPTTLEVQ